MTELLDIENSTALTAYLLDRGRIGWRESVEIRCLAGGVSNRTVLVRRGDGEAWVLKQALPKLRVQVDWFSDPDRNHHEATGMRWLGQLAPPGSIPRLVFEDRTQHLLAMEAVPDPHENWKTILLGGHVDPARIGQFAELLGTIHRRSAERSDELTDVFGDRQYFESLRLEPYYGYAAQQLTDAADFLHRLIAGTRQIRRTLVHGDYSPKNILLCGPRMVLVDHEVIHWGDPAFDLGFSLTHLLSKAHFLPECREQFAAAARQYWSDYLAQWGEAALPDGLETMAVRHTLGCLLARVAGRSPLEYLDEAHRARQRDAVVALMQRMPNTVDELTVDFIKRLAYRPRRDNLNEL
ncbi:MAG: phosphotransferase [Pirellulaceae bacterium]|nr:phosphotransferase [Pirellulaceae bacterium]